MLWIYYTIFFPLKQKRKNRKFSFFGIMDFYCHLFLADSVYGANVRAGAAIGANIGVNVVLGIAFADSLYGANAGARAAGNAFLTDFMWHNDFLHYVRLS